MPWGRPQIGVAAVSQKLPETAVIQYYSHYKHFKIKTENICNIL
jgi:hypothetical protein